MYVRIYTISWKFVFDCIYMLVLTDISRIIGFL